MVAGDALKQENTSADKPEIIRLYSVIDRLHPDDRFSRNWQSFEKIRQGELIAYRHDGVELSAEKDGWIVFPNPDAEVDQEWFYLADASERLGGNRKI